MLRGLLQLATASATLTETITAWQPGTGSSELGDRAVVLLTPHLHSQARTGAAHAPGTIVAECAAANLTPGVCNKESIGTNAERAPRINCPLLCSLTYLKTGRTKQAVFVRAPFKEIVLRFHWEVTATCRHPLNSTMTPLPDLELQ